MLAARLVRASHHGVVQHTSASGTQELASLHGHKMREQKFEHLWLDGRGFGNGYVVREGALKMALRDDTCVLAMPQSWSQNLSQSPSPSPFRHSATPNLITTIINTSGLVGSRVEGLNQTNCADLSSLHMDACDVHGRTDDLTSNRAIRHPILSEPYDFNTPDTIYFALQRHMNCIQVELYLTTQLALPLHAATFHAAFARDVRRHLEYLQHARLCLAVVVEGGRDG